MFSNFLLNAGPNSPGGITKAICKEFSTVYPGKRMYEFCEVHFENAFEELDKKSNGKMGDIVGMDGELDLMDLAGESLFGYCYLNVCLHHFEKMSYIEKIKPDLLKVITSNYLKTAPKEFQTITEADHDVIELIDQFFVSLDSDRDSF